MLGRVAGKAPRAVNQQHIFGHVPGIKVGFKCANARRRRRACIYCTPQTARRRPQTPCKLAQTRYKIQPPRAFLRSEALVVGLHRSPLAGIVHVAGAEARAARAAAARPAAARPAAARPAAARPARAPRRRPAARPLAHAPRRPAARRQVKRLTEGKLEVPVVASVVVSGSYEDDDDGIDELVYTGGRVGVWEGGAWGGGGGGGGVGGGGRRVCVWRGGGAGGLAGGGGGGGRGREGHRMPWLKRGVLGHVWRAHGGVGGQAWPGATPPPPGAGGNDLLGNRRQEADQNLGGSNRALLANIALGARAAAAAAARAPPSRRPRGKRPRGAAARTCQRLYGAPFPPRPRPRPRPPGVPVRVTRKNTDAASFAGAIFVYDGLYNVVRTHWRCVCVRHSSPAVAGPKNCSRVACARLGEGQQRRRPRQAPTRARPHAARARRQVSFVKSRGKGGHVVWRYLLRRRVGQPASICQPARGAPPARPPRAAPSPCTWAASPCLRRQPRAGPRRPRAQAPPPPRGGRRTLAWALAVASSARRPTRRSRTAPTWYAATSQRRAGARGGGGGPGGGRGRGRSRPQACPPHARKARPPRRPRRPPPPPRVRRARSGCPWSS